MIDASPTESVVKVRGEARLCPCPVLRLQPPNAATNVSQCCTVPSKIALFVFFPISQFITVMSVLKFLIMVLDLWISTDT